MVLINKQPKLSCHMASMPINDRRLIKALLKRVFFSIFALILTQSPTKKGVLLYYCIYVKALFKSFFSILALTVTITLPHRVILYFCSNPNRTLPGRVFFSVFALILTNVLPIRVFYSICAHILIKALPQRVFFSTFALILTNSLQKGVFLYFCSYLNQSAATKGIFPIFLPLF